MLSRLQLTVFAATISQSMPQHNFGVIELCKQNDFQELLSRRRACKNVVERKSTVQANSEGLANVPAAKVRHKVEHDFGGILRVGENGGNISLPHLFHASGQGGRCCPHKISPTI